MNRSARRAAGGGRFARALQHHQAGRLAEAEHGYQDVLATDPRHADSLHLLGLVARQTGRAALAVGFIRQAIAIDATAAPYHSSLGSALAELQRHDEAAECYRRALAGQPDLLEAHFNLGLVLRAQGQVEAAIASFRRAAALGPAVADIHNNLGLALLEQGRPDEAEASCRRAIALHPELPEAHSNLGNVLREQGRLEAAIASFRRAVVLRPGFADALNNLGNALREQGLLDEAVACGQQAVACQPDQPEAHNNLGNALKDERRLDAAIACYRRAIDLRPDFADAHVNLGNVLREQGDLDRAVACLRRAVALRPGFADAHYNLASALLTRGDLAEGWAEYEYRWQTRQMRDSRRCFAQPQWRGEPAEGRTLLIHAEQGFGDTLQFCRYAPLAAARGWRVILEVPAPLVRLLAGLPGVAEVVASGAALPPFDLHCPMLSLPLAFGTALESIPAATAYLRADPAPIPLAPHPRVGLVWAGNPRRHSAALMAVDRRRSLDPALLAPLLAVAGPTFFSLQKDGPPAPGPLTPIDLMAGVGDFADTASRIAGLDLVISVDTAVAHLAGALGKPVWLLDRHDACWRWLSGRRDSPWYPTLRIYRQPSPGDWAAVVAEVAGDLGRLVSGPCSDDICGGRWPD